MQQSAPLLSILIPTYNRAECLDLNLQCLVRQLTPELEGLIEVVISDNASTDHTRAILDKYRGNGFFKILESTQNIGAENNFLKLFDNCRGQFVWIFGDDEALLDGAIEKVFALLKKYPEAGLFHIIATGHESLEKFDYLLKYENPKIEVIQDANQFLSQVSFNISFISSHIFNRKYLSEDIRPKDFVGTSLVQESLFLQTALRGPFNVFIYDFLFSQLLNNTGGYKLFETFASNQQKIFGYFKSLGLKESTINKINKSMLRSFFPYLIYNQGKNINRDIGKFHQESPLMILFRTFKFYKNFWLYCLPLLLLPKGFHPVLANGVKSLRKLKSLLKSKVLHKC
jgi:glycosyltransferase involved in cell wall biosynthesis